MFAALRRPSPSWSVFAAWAGSGSTIDDVIRRPCLLSVALAVVADVYITVATPLSRPSTQNRPFRNIPEGLTAIPRCTAPRRGAFAPAGFGHLVYTRSGTTHGILSLRVLERERNKTNATQSRYVLSFAIYGAFSYVLIIQNVQPTRNIFYLSVLFHGPYTGLH